MLAAGLFAFCILIGCSPLAPKDVVGSYARSCLGVTDLITLETNGSFTQSVTFTNGEAWSCNGSWEIINQVIQLDKCYLTFNDEKQSIIIPPQTVYSCTFIISHGGLVRTELQPPWVKK